MEVFELFLCHKYKKQQNCFIILIFPKIQSFKMSQNIVANGKTFYCYPIQLTVFLSFSNSLEFILMNTLISPLTGIIDWN